MPLSERELLEGDMSTDRELLERARKIRSVIWKEGNSLNSNPALMSSICYETKGFLDAWIADIDAHLKETVQEKTYRVETGNGVYVTTDRLATLQQPAVVPSGPVCICRVERQYYGNISFLVQRVRWLRDLPEGEFELFTATHLHGDKP